METNFAPPKQAAVGSVGKPRRTGFRFCKTLPSDTPNSDSGIKTPLTKISTFKSRTKLIFFIAMSDEQNSWRSQRRQYLGEISALSFIYLPYSSSPPPFLLAGTGSQILVYEIEARKLLNSFDVFEGIRVHGISCNSHDSAISKSSAEHIIRIAVFGERRVKLFNLQFDMTSGNPAKAHVQLILVYVLPKFSHWVLDVCFLKEDDQPSRDGVKNHLAIGLSDNSVRLWDISSSYLVIEVKCPERCLLYSMRLWGDDIKSLHVASGTIYNKIVIWKLVQVGSTPSSTSLQKKLNYSGTSSGLSCQQYKAISLGTLSGHEGSIFRISWSVDGSTLMSVSDDRSARIWKVSSQKDNSSALKEATSLDVSAVTVLYGHTARVWDCCISESVIITAGEDCTCRVWGMDGSQLMVVKEHIGRGIWRCLYDPGSSLLITGGFDSAIKVRPLHVLCSHTTYPSGLVNFFKNKQEIFSICAKNLSKQLGPLNSKSEYIRCLQFAREDILYVATNHGYVHHVKLSDSDDVEWTQVVQVSKEVPIICMDLLRGPLYLSNEAEDWIAVGDGEGNAMVFRIINSASLLKVTLSFSWRAHKERQLLGIYWCKSLGCSYIFTADPGGRLKLWHLVNGLQSVGEDAQARQVGSLVAEFTSCFGSRIMCLDASFEEKVLVCGDQRGNVIIFQFLNVVALATSPGSEDEINPLTYFKGAHGISSVASILIAKSNFEQVEVRSTGGDGCICYFRYHEVSRGLEFMGMTQVKELSLIQSVFANSSVEDDLAQGNYAVGFASTDFIIWDLVNNTKILVVPCGGWRRPHTYFFGDVAKSQNCFAYLKDHIIHVHRLWVVDASERKSPQILHLQFHGREIHSLCFVSIGQQLNPNKKNNYLSRLSWIATGCEDGSVRLTRYTHVTGSWSGSKLLGEHVGGSAVRSICFISKIYTFDCEQLNKYYHEQRENSTGDSKDDQLLLISVGSKQVLTSWLLRNKRQKAEAFVNGTTDNENMSFQWLATHMPPKFASTRKNIEEEKMDSESKLTFWEHNENDWRYLSVTAFLVKNSYSRLVVCFVVVACSDATLTLRALLLPSRLWYDVALLVPQTSPVLALQHVVIPIGVPSKDCNQIENKYLVVSGSTDGSITFWDLTETVESFMQQVLTVQPENFIDCQRRPRTGRGSQGGRWWRSLPNYTSKKCPLDPAEETFPEDTDRQTTNQAASPASSGVGSDPKNDPTVEISELQPLHVVNSVHQSGVNCLHISSINGPEDSESGSVFYVLSGGDDQALHCLVFDYVSSTENLDVGPRQHADLNSQDTSSHEKRSMCSGTEYWLRCLSCNRIASAHSSAVKGVWTDGIWVFSTGLDQRVRCWRLCESGKLAEHTHLIISVPEPETLNAQACGRGQYLIAVAGRGMQMVEFSTDLHE